MAAPPLLLLTDTRLAFGTTTLLGGASLSVAPGERLALVGRNGSGKSTLLRIAAGLSEADSGTRFLQPGATLRYLPQEPDLAGHASVLAYVESGLTGGDDAHRAHYLIEALGLTGAEHPDTLSGGEARRAALARALAPEPDILLLDEPTNHLDLPAIEWLESELGRLRSAIVTISHDRRFLERLSRAMVWLDRGNTLRLERGFAHFETWRDEILAVEEQNAQKLARQIVREEHWLRYGVTARRKRNVKRLGDLQALRQKKRERQGPQGNVRMAASEAEGSGNLVALADNATKVFGDRTVIREANARIMRGDRIGIVGPNGAGKTTLLKLLTGELEPDSGTIRRGTAIAMVTLDQKREALPPETTLSQALTEGRGDQVFINGQPRHVVGYMKDFLFLPEQARTAVSVLSGGERGRLMLARAFARPSNLLVLDEPTNDLDLETLDLLQELIAEYGGTVLVVSHDRDFLDRTVTGILAFEGDGRWQDYAGGYSDMIAQRGRGVEARAAAEAASRPRGAASVATSTTTRKMTFKDKHALDALPGRMDKLTAEIALLRTKLADGALFTRDYLAFKRFTNGLALREAELTAAEEDWLRLESLREAVEA